MVSAIELFDNLRFHSVFLLSVEGFLYYVPHMYEGLSVVFPMWRLLLVIGTHVWCLLIFFRILLVILQKARRLVLS